MMPGRAVLACSVVLAAASGIAACSDSAPAAPTPAPAVTSLSLNPARVTAGAPSEATVSLDRAAAAGAVIVTLSSSDAAAAVPESIAVGAGSSQATFRVTTRVVAATTPVTITASAGGERRQAVLQVETPLPPPATLQSLEVAPAVLRGGDTAQGIVRLTGRAPASGLTVFIRSSHAAALVPNTVTVAAGATSATFAIPTRPVALETHLEITATASSVVQTAAIRLTP